jgi:tRNA modification GTPase
VKALLSPTLSPGVATFEPARAAGGADTIAALATPAGTSALALIRVTGPECRALAAAIFGRPAAELPERRAAYGVYRAAGPEARVLDDLVWVFCAGPRSATGEDTLELSCHGNPLIAQLILDDLFRRGCRAAEPGEFTRRAFLNGRLELSQAEAVMDLIHARSERALAAAQRQLQGELGRHLEGLIQDLLLNLSRVEVYIDFPDEDLPPENRRVVVEGLRAVLRGTGRLLATHRYGDLLRDGLKTVLLGAPNAGKSSLLNRLVGAERALVSPEPGTTRDFIEERLQVGPHLLRLIDTAGVNPAAGGLESLGIAKTAERLAEADLVLWVVDATLPHPSLPEAFASRLDPAKTILLRNKVDLLTGETGSADGVRPEGWRVVSVSAQTGEGLDEVRAAIVALADGLQPSLFTQEQIAINARHADALRRAEAGLEAAVAGLEAVPAAPIELVSGDIRGALDALGEIAGRVDNERMLDALFANFCIGK